MKTGLKILGFVVALSFVGVLVKIVFFPAHVANQVVNTAQDAVDKTINADNAIFNYEQFKDQYNDAKAQIANIEQDKKDMENLKNTYGEPNTWTKDIRDQQQHFQENLDGHNMMYQSIVKEYNSNSSKINRKLFKDKNLPSELPLDYTQFPQQ